MRTLVAPALGVILVAATWLVPDTPPDTRVRDCTSGGCHASEIDFNVLHGPVAAGACEMCHEYRDPAIHEFALKRQGAALCDFCHIGKTDEGGLLVHEPVATGQCLACHNPHGADSRVLLKTASEGEMCMACHEAIVEGRNHLHTPVQNGDCLGCHRAHSALLPKLLIDEGRALCQRCHAAVMALPEHDALDGAPAEIAAAGDRMVVGVHADGPRIHEPFRQECSACHEHHASNTPAVLTQPTQALCASCHEDIVEKIAGATVPHSAVAGDRACLNCHSPHQSAVGHLMKGDATSVCLTCHEQPVQRADGTTVAGMSSLKDAHGSLHKPIETGCAGCHDVHGASHRALLVQPYSQSFYQTPATAAYALCFTCHDQKLMTEPRTTTATKFRNGDVNLHFTHVTQPGDKGRSCRVCHETHAAPSKRLLQKSVPFGEWPIPISFTATQNGGSCAAGCHRPQTYTHTP